MYIIKELNFLGNNEKFLGLLFIGAIYCAICVITAKNSIISILFLIGLFICISVYLITLGINFIALSYLLVYVGAVSILFLFILMLINIRTSELINNTNNGTPLAIIISILFIFTIYEIFPYYKSYLSIYLDSFFDNNLIMYGSSKVWESNLAEFSYITCIGNIMYTSYYIWLIVTSLILLLAMVGTICLVIS